VDTVAAGVLALGPAGVAPLRSPCAAGTRYVVAEIEAVICGKPFGPAAKVIALSVISRPLTDTCLLLATTKRCRRLKKSARWKKLPWNLKVNGSTGKPAGPIDAPGGNVAIDVCVTGLAAAGELVFPGVVLVVAAAAAAGADAAPAVPGFKDRSRKSTFA
jgi:hypothetical protein